MYRCAIMHSSTKKKVEQCTYSATVYIRRKTVFLMLMSNVRILCQLAKTYRQVTGLVKLSVFTKGEDLNISVRGPWLLQLTIPAHYANNLLSLISLLISNYSHIGHFHWESYIMGSCTPCTVISSQKLAFGISVVN